jgi:hypothetical protein
MFNLLKPTVSLINQQFNIQQLYVLPTLYLCILYLSENKQRFCHLQHKLVGFYNRYENVYCAVRTGSLKEAVCASSSKGLEYEYVVEACNSHGKYKTFTHFLT